MWKRGLSCLFMHCGNSTMSIVRRKYEDKGVCSRVPTNLQNSVFHHIVPVCIISSPTVDSLQLISAGFLQRGLVHYSLFSTEDAVQKGGKFSKFYFFVSVSCF